MKTKNITILFCFIIAAAFTLGVTGICRITEDSVAESHGSDRMIGVLITKEYLDLFDSDRYFRENVQKLIDGGDIGDAELDRYQGRLYASKVEIRQNSDTTGESVTSKEYVFEGIDGIRFFALYNKDESGSFWSTNIDEGITDCNTQFTTTDAGESISLKGTIYVTSQRDAGNLYLNPVYQSSNGDVYAVSGNGVFLGDESSQGISWSQKISENQTATADNINAASNTEVEVTVCVMNKPINIALVQFNGKNELLERTEYSPGTLPESIYTLSDTQYILVETSSSEDLNRTIIQHKDGFAHAFYSRDDGICVEQSCEIYWNE